MTAPHDLPHCPPAAQAGRSTPPRLRPQSPARPRRDLADELTAISGELDQTITAARLGRTRRERDQVVDTIERLAAALRRSVRG